MSGWGFDFLGVVGGGAGLDQVLDFEQFGVMFSTRLLGRTGERDFDAVPLDPLEQRAHAGERLHLRQKLAF